MRCAIVLLAAPALLAAGCGGSTPRLARADAAPIISLADRIARESPCAQKRDLAAVRTKAIALVDRKAVPAGLEEPFLAAANDLAARTPDCVPPPPPPAAQPAPPPAPPMHDHGQGHDNGHGHGHGDGGGDQGDG